MEYWTGQCSILPAADACVGMLRSLLLQQLANCQGIMQQRPTLAIAGAAVLPIQVEAAHDVAEDVLLAPAARAAPVPGALCPRHISYALRAPAACCQLVQLLM